MDVEQGVVSGPDGFCDQGHCGVCWSAASFSDIAFHTGTNDIGPDGFSTESSWNDVVEGKFCGGVFFAAILAGVFVSGEDVSAVELHFILGESVVKQEAYDSRDCDVEIYGRDPVVAIGFEVSLEFTDIPPGVEIVREIFTLFAGDNFCEFPQQQ
jgi:hypothetical protein